ncbi:MAG: LysM peptidoglycan-binding domain-containing protein [Bacteroidetes bacterium]|nr:LysM peptidoglycan-binding domain-containing protein [Bacteroidota bacterium]
MKKLCTLLMMIPFWAMAQKVITHTVGPKESLTSIGRLYNINGRELANFNKIDYNKGLTIGQVLKIPVKKGVVIPPSAKTAPSTKETAPAKTANKENGAPIYHTVGKKETLYHISTIYHTTVADIKKWNNLTTDGVNEGAQLIVGYNAGKATIKTQPDIKPAKPVEAPPAPPKTEEAAPQTKPVQPPAPEKKDLPPLSKPAQEEATASVPAKATDFNGGYFKTLYDEQVRGHKVAKDDGAAGIFKSTSGWEDGKYYCLYNDAAPGTILQVTNTANGKVVYVKVLDMISDIKQNNGLVIRISNAAADILGVTDTKFGCTINYSK